MEMDDTPDLDCPLRMSCHLYHWSAQKLVFNSAQLEDGQTLLMMVDSCKQLDKQFL